MLSGTREIELSLTGDSVSVSTSGAQLDIDAKLSKRAPEKISRLMVI